MSSQPKRDEPTLGVKFNTWFIPTTDWPEWADNRQQKLWSMPGLVVWDNELHIIVSLGYNEAFTLLDFIRVTNDWEMLGLRIGNVGFRLRRSNEPPSPPKTIPEPSFPIIHGGTFRRFKSELTDAIDVTPVQVRQLLEVLKQREPELRAFETEFWRDIREAMSPTAEQNSPPDVVDIALKERIEATVHLRRAEYASNMLDFLMNTRPGAYAPSRLSRKDWPNWTNSYQQRLWNRSGVIVCNHGTRQIIQWFAIWALDVLEQLRASSAWQRDGLTVGQPVITEWPSVDEDGKLTKPNYVLQKGTEMQLTPPQAQRLLDFLEECEDELLRMHQKDTGKVKQSIVAATLYSAEILVRRETEREHTEPDTNQDKPEELQPGPKNDRKKK